MTRVDLLTADSTGDRVATSICLIRDGDTVIVSDPGVVANRRLIVDALRALGVEPGDVDLVSICHHHPDHTMTIARCRTPTRSTSRARYRDAIGPTTRATGTGSGRVRSCG